MSDGKSLGEPQVPAPLTDAAEVSTAADMGTHEQARLALFTKAAAWRAFRQPIIGTAARIRENDIAEREARFQLANAALLWLWHEEARLRAAIAGADASGEKAGITQAAEGSEPSSDSEKAMSWLFDVINCLCAEVPSLNEAIYARTIRSELLRLKSLNAELREGLERFDGHRIGFGQSTDMNKLFDARQHARSLLSRTT